MLERLKHNAEKFFHESEKVRKEAESRNDRPVKGAVSPPNKAAGDSAKVVKGTTTSEKDKKNAASTTDPNKNKPADAQQKQAADKVPVKKAEKVNPAREDAVKTTIPKNENDSKQTSSNNNIMYGVAAAAAIGVGLFVAYKMYQGQSVDVISADIPVTPEI